MAISLDCVVDAPSACLLIMAITIVIGVCLGEVLMWDVIKELALLSGVTSMLMWVFGQQIPGFANKESGKAENEPCHVVAPQSTPAPASVGRPLTRSGALRTLDKAASHRECLQPSKRPVLPPTFTSTSFNDQADELSQQLLPTDRCQRVVQEIARDIKKAIMPVLPYADVIGFTNGEVSRGTAYGVAVPEVDIVVNLPPHILVRTVQTHNNKLSFSGKVDDRRLHKSAIRMCTDLLVSSGGFKFRRSAFRGRDPKVTLMAPQSLDESGSCIPIDFAVNAPTPMCNSVLIAACAQVDPRARMLVLLVKRWAKDRGIAHAAKGHMMPYAWTLLCIYFLQVGVKEGSLLPPFKQLRLAPGKGTTDIAGLAQCMQGWTPPASGSVLATKRLGQLFKEFINFYLNEVDWSWEVVSIRSGQRNAAKRCLKPLVIETPEGPKLGPTIEDPFMPSENMSEMLTAHGLTRLKEELTRSQECFESNVPLSEILTQWVPPEQRNRTDDCDGALSGDEEPEASAAKPLASSGARSVKAVPPTKAMMPPPGLWVSNGRPPAPWPSTIPSTNTA